MNAINLKGVMDHIQSPLPLCTPIDRTGAGAMSVTCQTEIQEGDFV